MQQNNIKTTLLHSVYRRWMGDVNWTELTLLNILAAEELNIWIEQFVKETINDNDIRMCEGWWQNSWKRENSYSPRTSNSQPSTSLILSDLPTLHQTVLQCRSVRHRVSNFSRVYFLVARLNTRPRNRWSRANDRSTAIFYRLGRSTRLGPIVTTQLDSNVKRSTRSTSSTCHVKKEQLGLIPYHTPPAIYSVSIILYWFIGIRRRV